MKTGTKHPLAVIQTSLGVIQIEIYPEYAPNAAGAFLDLAKRGLYDHRKIRRVVPGFVLQPSYCFFDDPRCDISLNGEYRSNGIENALPFEKGTVAMAGEGTVASGSEFFITLSDDADAALPYLP